jgi:SAM-dependent methyltransferase
LHDADRGALKRGDVASDLVARIRNDFRDLQQLMTELLVDESGGNPRIREELGYLAQRELLPYLLLTQWGERAYSKPRGYAGDYLTIKMIYDNQEGGTGRLGPVLDRCLLDEAAAQAVRNRRGLMASMIRRVLDESEGPVRVASLACGPAEELFDVFLDLPDKKRLRATLVDFDLQALAYVSDRSQRLGLRGQIDLRDDNLIYVALGRRQPEMKPQDLVYSVGLIDYFSDYLATQLLDVVHDLLRPGGRVVVGNFHPRNSTRALMDHVLDWKLNHRTEDDLNRLFQSSKFGRPATSFEFEATGVNLFATCMRD